MNNLSRFLLNSFATVGGTFISIALGILIIPYLIGQMGEEAYGLVALFSAIFAVAAILDGGVYNATLRLLSIKIAEDDVAGYNNTYSSALIWVVFLTVLVTVIVYIFSGEIISVFGKIPDDLKLLAEKMLPIHIFNSAINTFIIPIMLAVLASKNRFDLSAYIRSGVLIVQVVVWYVVLKFSTNKFEAWVWSNTIVFVPAMILAMGIAKLQMRSLHFVIVFNLKSITTLMSLTGKLFVIRISLLAMQNVYHFLFSAFGSLAMNTIYQISTRSSGILSQISDILSNQILPHLSTSFVKGDYKRISRVYTDFSRMLFSIVGCISVLAIFNSDYLFEMWLANAMPENWKSAMHLFNWFLIIFLFATTSSVQYNVLLAIDKLGKTIVFYVLKAVLSILGVFYLLKYTTIGIYSVVYVNAMNCILTVIYMGILLRIFIKVSIWKQLMNIYTRGIFFICFLSIFCFVLKMHTPDCHTMLKLIFNVFPSSIVGILLLFFVGMSKGDRIRVKEIPFVKRILTKISCR